MSFLHAARLAVMALVIVVGSVGFGSPPVHAGDDRPEALATMLKAWRAREAKAESVRFAWTARRQLTQGSLMPAVSARDHGMDEPAASKGIPPEDLEHEVPCELLMKGDWMRYETRSLGFAEDYSAHLNDYVSSYDGDSSRIMTRPRELRPHEAGGKSGTGSIRTERRNTDAPSQPLVPLLLHLRPLAKGFTSFKANRLKVTGTEPMGGRRCLVVEDSGERGSLGYRLWVDPGCDHAVRRWESFRSDGTVVLRAEISYAPSESLGWVPDRWGVSVLDRKGKVIRSHSGELTEHAVGLRLTQEDFRLEFPPGTRVYDQIRQEEYIVGKDGSRLPVRLREAEKAGKSQR